VPRTIRGFEEVLMKPCSPRLIRAGALSLLSLVLAGARPAAAGFVNFDSVAAAPGGTHYPGSTFSAQGVSFQSASVPNFVFVGQTITLSNMAPRMMVLGNGSAISNPNFAAAAGVFTGSTNDLLMVFSSPVDFVKVLTDDTPETPDTVRLLALQPTANPSQFVVTALRSGNDDATFSPFNVLSLNLTGKATQYVLFQVTTEAEGIDNLWWEEAPDCRRQGAILDPGCFQQPPFAEWIPVGCEIVDCCPGCPGAELQIDWVINYAGDPFEVVVLRFEDLSREVAAGLRVEGDARWDAATQQLEVHGAGQVVLRGFPGQQGDLKWSATSPRMTLERIDAPAGTGAPRALRVKVQQQVGGEEISDSSLVYVY
jgi:hypothetical protein